MKLFLMTFIFMISFVYGSYDENVLKNDDMAIDDLIMTTPTIEPIGTPQATLQASIQNESIEQTSETFPTIDEFLASFPKKVRQGSYEKLITVLSTIPYELRPLYYEYLPQIISSDAWQDILNYNPDSRNSFGYIWQLFTSPGLYRVIPDNLKHIFEEIIAWVNNNWYPKIVNSIIEGEIVNVSMVPRSVFERLFTTEHEPIITDFDMALQVTLIHNAKHLVNMKTMSQEEESILNAISMIPRSKRIKNLGTRKVIEIIKACHRHEKDKLKQLFSDLMMCAEPLVHLYRYNNLENSFKRFPLILSLGERIKNPSVKTKDFIRALVKKKNDLYNYEKRLSLLKYTLPKRFAYVMDDYLQGDVIDYDLILQLIASLADYFVLPDIRSFTDELIMDGKDLDERTSLIDNTNSNEERANYEELRKQSLDAIMEKVKTYLDDIPYQYLPMLQLDLDDDWEFTKLIRDAFKEKYVLPIIVDHTFKVLDGILLGEVSAIVAQYLGMSREDALKHNMFTPNT